MIRKIIQIDEKRCNGCGACANACHEGAIGMVNGKAKLLRDDYCDGLGDCLPACPMDAIHFVEREAAAYDEAAVQLHKEKRTAHACPGSMPREIHPSAPCGCAGSAPREVRHEGSAAGLNASAVPGQLRQWPVQIQLAPTHAPYFQNAELLIAADCTAYAYGNFHEDFIRGRVVLIGCPKLDPLDYAEKLEAIFRQNSIRRVLVTRMMVPCCGGMERAVQTALDNAASTVPLEIVTIDADGKILERRRYE